MVTWDLLEKKKYLGCSDSWFFGFLDSFLHSWVFLYHPAQKKFFKRFIFNDWVSSFSSLTGKRQLSDDQLMREKKIETGES